MIMGRPAIDLTGQHFGRLTVIKRVENANDGHAKWECQCECGNITYVSSNVLKKGNTKSCGCLNKEVAKNKAINTYKNLTNQRFGKLVARECLGSNGKQEKLWRCDCDCGNHNFITTTHHLTSGNTQSCGCLKSKGEEKILNILQNYNIQFQQQKQFQDLPLKRFDFYLPEINRLIEFDGQQHYFANGGWSTQENLQIVKERDKEKNEYALSHNISLVRIPYWERDNITLEMLMGDQYLVHETHN